MFFHKFNVTNIQDELGRCSGSGVELRPRRSRFSGSFLGNLSCEDKKRSTTLSSLKNSVIKM